MVGAGGIGCELLKDLVLTGFGEIHIIDLDTITLSNLNRQFLFRRNDIDKSKALIVAQAVEKFNYFGCKLVPHHGNVTDSTQFPLGWWGQFDYIYNALDNLEARRYVNKMCLFVKKPLMESGTTGFQGQIQPIYPYLSECFDCAAKAAPKTFPVCTIRSTPSLPVHCITWAKEFLFQQLFDEVQTLTPEEQEIQRKQLQAENANRMEVENIMNETNELYAIRQSMYESPKAFINDLMLKVFHDDIKKALQIESLWRHRQPPTPLDTSLYGPELDGLFSDKDPLFYKQDTQVWSPAQNLWVLYKSAESLAYRVTEKKEKIISFDKDDEDTLDFVAAAANLRALVFHIEIKSKFDIKEIAGNVIPAIATTNAIVSGFSCLESLKYFEQLDQNSAFKNSSTVFITMKPNKYVTAAKLVGVNEKCPSSALSSRGVLEISEAKANETTLKNLIAAITETYGYEGDISLVLGKDKLIYDFDFDDNVDTLLGHINGFTSGELLLVQDEEDILENLELYIEFGDKDFELQGLELRPKKSPPAEPANEPQLDEDVQENGSNESNMVIIDEEEENGKDADEIEELEVIDAEEQPPLKKQRN